MQGLGQNAPFAIAGAAPELRVNVNGYFNLFSGGGLGSETETFNYRARFTLAKGSHFLQFGMDVARDLMFSYDRSFASGTTTFATSRNVSTGDAFADFLLGLPQDFNQAARTPQDFYQTSWMPWFQDDWKVNRRFTLNLGIRWEPWLPADRPAGAGDGFYPRRTVDGRSVRAHGPGLYGRSGAASIDLSRRLDELCTARGIRVGRAGERQERGPLGLWNLLSEHPPEPGARCKFRKRFPFAHSRRHQHAEFSESVSGYCQSVPVPAAAEQRFKHVSLPSPTVTSTLDPASKTGYVQQWNFTVERQIRSDIGLSLAYVGNHSIGIMSTYQANPARYIAGSTLSVDARRIYPGLGGLAVASPWGFKNYNGLRRVAKQPAEVCRCSQTTSGLSAWTIRPTR